MDDHVHRVRQPRIEVHFDVATPFIYDVLLGEEKNNPTGGIKLDVIITGPEQYISTVDNNLVQVAVHQNQPLLHLFLSTNRGVTTCTATVLRLSLIHI